MTFTPMQSVGCVEVAEIGALQASRVSPRICPWMPRYERTVFQQPRTLRPFKEPQRTQREWGGAPAIC